MSDGLRRPKSSGCSPPAGASRTKHLCRRGVLHLEVTKSGKRREVPMRQAVYDILAAIPEKHRVGRVWPAGNIRRSFETGPADQAGRIFLSLLG